MISVVLPVYNEEEVLPTLYERLNRAAQTWGQEYEIILVNDGSTDRSAEQLFDIHQRDPRWKVLSFSRNFGHQAAISAGIHYSSGDAVVIMDADLQDPPEELGRFLAKWQEGYQVVYAIRTKRKEGILKRAAYAGFYRVLRRVASIDIPLDSGDFCVLDRSVVEVLRALPERTRFVRGLRSWAGFRQIGVAYERHARQMGAVKYTFSKLVQLALDGIFSFSNTPLKVSGWLGIGLCAASLLLIALLIGWRIADVQVFGMNPNAVVGWTSLCSLILLLAGMQMLVIGIIGEYLARVFDEVKSRPPWIIADACGFDSAEQSSQPGWHVPDRALATRRLPAPYARAG